jgi:hypothetical protein
MTTISIISNTTFKTEEYQSKMGTGLFPSQLYDCLHHVDTKRLRKRLIADGFQFVKGAKILKILTHTDEHPDYKNIQNEMVRYRTPICASRDMAGAFYYQSAKIPQLQYWATNHPVSDVIIVVSKVE